ncbi:SDR family NAD(P)-dependent oxidoreductase [uncultured Hyphomonas sp.]|uniref:SDR family oxidoreductase n=1 Tax=uncultured Hyphomonas sp. TaxID=225298 RepID=UPI002AAB6B68|nr:SDR family NAD(P)-dependent oxidoreductase [uncultured Hyphomonas sp.]
MQLTGNTIFITGSTSGIGRAMAEAFHKLGNQVIISGRRKPLLDEVTMANPGMAAIELDISDPESIEEAAERLVTDFPKLNVLVNNAGIMPFDDPSAPLNDEIAQRIVTTNFLGPVRMSSALIEHLKRQPRATILYNSSVLAYVPLAGNAVYSASKAAIHSYAMSQRFMLRDTPVRVQEIAPPWVNTDLIYKGNDPRAMDLEDFIQETMRKLSGDDEEIIVDAILEVRANPGANEHAMVNAFNADMIENPIPVTA